MRIVNISDNHNHKIKIPDGDLLIHAGDFTMRGRLPEVGAFLHWFEALPHKYKVFIAGNHDRIFENDPVIARSLVNSAIYLQDSEVTIEGLRIWGAPWQPWFYDWAFNMDRGPKILAKWQLIPTGVDVLITHGPPMDILDRVPDGTRVGCADLSRELVRIKPKLHVFGHIHDAYGKTEKDGTIYVNASICDEAYHPVNPPIVIDL